jgi:pimeloyl-ACP methyl ester carboxylesterase
MRRFRINIRDGETAGIAFGDPVRPVEIMFLHATGFNAITYQSILEPLGTQAHVAAVDMRGHGRSKLPAHPSRLNSWNRFRDDVIQILEQTSPNGTVLAGHSMGATVSLLVAARRPDLVRALVLVDPVLMKTAYYRWRNIPLVGQLGSASALSKGALRRRKVFGSPQEAADTLRGRGAFKTWRSPFLDDYVIDGVLRQDNGEFALACTPQWESAVFKAHAYRPWGAVKKLKPRKKQRRAPLIVLQADKESTSAPDTDVRIHAVRPDAAVTKVPGTTHFVPMERPYVVRDALRLMFEATIEGAGDVDYVGAVRRTIDDSIGIMG